MTKMLTSPLATFVIVHEARAGRLRRGTRHGYEAARSHDVAIDALQELAKNLAACV